MNKSNQNFSILRRIQSFGFACNGLRILLKEEHNAWIHSISAIVAIIAGLFFQITTFEWVSIIFSIGFVICSELINTAIENMCDHITLEKHDTIKKIKDLSAASVFISAITALIVGLIVFVPKILSL